MKFLVLSAAVSLGVVSAVLPPGYEDEMYCPPETCQFYTNPFGYVGAKSDFNKCFDPAKGEVIEAVWTGSLTNVTAPEDWIQDPPRCTKEEYSECETDEDCGLHIMDKIPSSDVATGGGLPECLCYVDSYLYPPSPCLGNNDKGCEKLQCTGNECDSYVASCTIDSEGGVGTCAIDFPFGTDPTPPEPADTKPMPPEPTDTKPTEVAEPTASGSTDASEPTAPIQECTVDDDCFPVLRSRAPVSFNATGPVPCECYASSSVLPFDECEGEKGKECEKLKCDMTERDCEEMEAYCEVVEGKCALREVAISEPPTDDGKLPKPSANETAPPPAEVETEPSTIGDNDVASVECDVDDDCTPRMRSRVPSTTNVTGVDVCECYADSLLEPFDECQGEKGKTCPMAGCKDDSCIGMEAFCREDKTCDLREVVSDAASSSTAATTAAPPSVECVVDDDCSPAIRSEAPSTFNATGAGLCECYAASSLEPFDECEGDKGKDCKKAKCPEDACDGMEAYCEAEAGICVLREMGNVTEPAETDAPTPVVTDAPTPVVTDAPTQAGTDTVETAFLSLAPTPSDTGKEPAETPAPTPSGTGKEPAETPAPTPSGTEKEPAETPEPTPSGTEKQPAETPAPTPGKEEKQPVATDAPTAGGTKGESSTESPSVASSNDGAGAKANAVVSQSTKDVVSSSAGAAARLAATTFVVAVGFIVHW